ncbi:MAG: pimeloyl-ACP methyl ester carboxylesterase [Arenicella sp.]|jgi:pimeloyl-ACP methyl ester carboxylesterase
MAKLEHIKGDIETAVRHVVLIHGLTGDRLKTWTNNDDIFWPNWIADDVKDTAVWTLGYEAPQSKFSRKTSSHLFDLAVNIRQLVLSEERLSFGEVVFIGHSMGGLIIKQMLLSFDQKARATDIRCQNLMVRVRRVIFLATPHGGSSLSDIQDLLRVILRPSLSSAALKKDAPELRRIKEEYKTMSTARNLQHLTLFETQPYKFWGIRTVLIVTPSSADPGLNEEPVPIAADHDSICKPLDKSSDIYRFIIDFILEAPLEPAQYFLERGLVQNNVKTLQHGNLELKPKGAAPRTLDDSLGDDTRAGLEQIDLYSALTDVEIENQLSRILKLRFFVGFDLLGETLKLLTSTRCLQHTYKNRAIRDQALCWCARIFAHLGEKEHHTQAIDSCTTHVIGNENYTIAKAIALITEKGYEQALATLDVTTSIPMRTAAFSIILKFDNAKEAISWSENSAFEFLDYDSNGRVSYINALLELRQWEEALECARTLVPLCLKETPALAFVAGIACLSNSITTEIRASVLNGLPINPSSFPLMEDSKSVSLRRLAIDFLTSCEESLSELGEPRIIRSISDYILWLELRDSSRSEIALQRLSDLLKGPIEQRIRLVPMAQGFEIELDLEAIEKDIDILLTRTGGRSEDAIFARFAIAMNISDPNLRLIYIRKYRVQLESRLNPEDVIGLEVDSLVQSNQVENAIALVERLDETKLSSVRRTAMLRSIAVHQAEDPITLLKKLYDETKGILDLKNLVGGLIHEESHEETIKWASILLDKTHEIEDAKALISAAGNIGRHDIIAETIQKYPEFANESEYICYAEAQAHYFFSRFDNCLEKIDKLNETSTSTNIIRLKTSCLISSGDWESLVPAIDEYWKSRDSLEPKILIELAKIAKVILPGRAKDLIISAVAKAPDQPKVLSDAYFMASRLGWEDDLSARGWFSKALHMSDNEGPLYTVSIEELVKQASSFRSRSDEIVRKLLASEIPVFAAMDGFNQSLSDYYIKTAILNAERAVRDPLKLIPAFRNTELRMSSSVQTIGLDISTLLILEYLDLFDLATRSFKQVLIPHNCLIWLFNETERNSFHQPSQVNRAKNVLSLIGTGSLTVCQKQDEVLESLSVEIGEELADLATASQIKHGVSLVVCPQPIKRPGVNMDQNASIDDPEKFASTINVVNYLWEEGVLNTEDKAMSLEFLNQHDRGLSTAFELSGDTTIYLSGLALSYLQDTNLLEKLCGMNKQIHIHWSVMEESRALVFGAQYMDKTRNHLDKLRKSLSRGIQNGQVMVCSARENHQIADEKDQHPTMNLFEMLGHCDAVLIDDPFFNSNGYFTYQDQQIPIHTTLELITYLESSGKIQQDNKFSLLHRLRNSGFSFLPVECSEILFHIGRSTLVGSNLVETSELNTIKQNLDIHKISASFKLPRDHNWLSSNQLEISKAIKQHWLESDNLNLSRACASWLYELLDYSYWAHCFSSESGLTLAKEADRLMLMSLLSSPTEATHETRTQYWNWLTSVVLSPITVNTPRLFSNLVASVKAEISQLLKSISEKESLQIERFEDYVLEMFPPIIRDQVLSDHEFCDDHRIPYETIFSFDSTKTQFRKSELNQAISEFHETNENKEIRTVTDDVWELRGMAEEGGDIYLKRGSDKLMLGDYCWPFIPNLEHRKEKFASIARQLQFTSVQTTDLIRLIDQGKLSNDEIDSVFEIIKNTPVNRYQKILHAFRAKEPADSNILVPDNEDYYLQLVGKWEASRTLSDFTKVEHKKFVEQFGLNVELDLRIRSVLLSCPYILASSNLELLNPDVNELNNSLNWLARFGDPYSRVAAIEFGLSKLKEIPELENALINVISALISQKEQYKHLSYLLMLVYGELSRAGTLDGRPIFYIRIAAASQASLIYRAAVASEVDISSLAEWGRQNRQYDFFSQAYLDLREENTWLPSYIQPTHLEADILGRIRIAGEGHKDFIKPGELRNILFDTSRPMTLGKHLTLNSWMPSFIESRDLERIMTDEIKKSVYEDLAKEESSLDSLVSFINSAMFWSPDIDLHLPVVCEILSNRGSKLFFEEPMDRRVEFLESIAGVAGTNRLNKLSDALYECFLTNFSTLDLSKYTEQLVLIGMISASAHKDSNSWSEYLVKWCDVIISNSTISRRGADWMEIWINSILINESDLKIGQLGRLHARLRNLRYRLS